jgi:hypothetical protein
LANAAQESIRTIYRSELVSLSEQNFVDCLTSCYDCTGNNADLTGAWVKQQENGFSVQDSDSTHNIIPEYGQVAVAMDAIHWSFEVYTVEIGGCTGAEIWRTVIIVSREHRSKPGNSCLRV